MNRIYVWLLFSITFSPPTAVAQESDTALKVTPKILSSSSFEKNGHGGLSVSIGFMHSMWSIGNSDGEHSNFELQDSTKNSKVFTKKALRLANISTGNAQDLPTSHLERTEDASVYPNPFKNRITVLVNEPVRSPGKVCQFTFLDVTGRIVKKGLLKSGERHIEMGSIPKGVYFLVLYQNDEKLESFKLLKTDL